MLQDGAHISVFLQREGAETKQGCPLMTQCHAPHRDALQSGASLHGAHIVMKQRDILKLVIDNAERRLKRRK